MKNRMRFSRKDRRKQRIKLEPKIELWGKEGLYYFLCPCGMSVDRKWFYCPHCGIKFLRKPNGDPVITDLTENEDNLSLR